MDSSYLMWKISPKFQLGHPQQGHQTEVGYGKSDDFRPISRYISETVQDTEIVTIEC